MLMNQHQDFAHVEICVDDLWYHKLYQRSDAVFTYVSVYEAQNDPHEIVECHGTVGLDLFSVVVQVCLHDRRLVFSELARAIQSRSDLALARGRMEHEVDTFSCCKICFESNNVQYS